MVSKFRLPPCLTVGATILLVFAGAGTWLLWPSSPLLALSTHRLDLGDGKPREKMRGVFQIRNVGSEPLEYQIQSSCSCTELKPRSGTVAPGVSQEVSLVLVLPEYAGSEQSAHIVVKSNDPHRPVTTCLATAKCPTPFEVMPKFINLGDVVHEDLDSTVEVLEIRGLEGKALENPGQLRFHHESKHIRVVSEAANDGVVRLRVSLSPQIPCTEVYDTLELRLGDSDCVVNVPMHARVLHLMSVVPSIVFLRIDSATGKYLPVDLLLVASHRADVSMGKVSVVDGPPGVEVIDAGQVDTALRRLCLIVKDISKLGSEIEVPIRCEGIASPFVLRVIKPQSEAR